MEAHSRTWTSLTREEECCREAVWVAVSEKNGLSDAQSPPLRPSGHRSGAQVGRGVARQLLHLSQPDREESFPTPGSIKWVKQLTSSVCCTRFYNQILLIYFTSWLRWLAHFSVSVDGWDFTQQKNSRFVKRREKEETISDSVVD